MPFEELPSDAGVQSVGVGGVPPPGGITVAGIAAASRLQVTPMPR